ncbi:hypothetical protein FB472_2311 [Rhodoglobus vestalii]|uniref:Uncharacterized protein n=1 Tax=Rhodoglobus vestalii TaxID=193384 RepID=A0A8H2KAI6_9MICO|nr:hypothetical protein FB472_2311 [Rhodoglobus vestalii]
MEARSVVEPASTCRDVGSNKFRSAACSRAGVFVRVLKPVFVFGHEGNEGVAALHKLDEAGPEMKPRRPPPRESDRPVTEVWA